MAPRLDTPLSRALLDSGSIEPSALEDAVQEQVIHGGALDTILLEKGIVEERTLAALLATAWQTEPVSLGEIERPAVEATRALPERMALAMRLCPFRLHAESGALHVLCAAPLDRALLDEVSALLSRALVPHVVPEVRLWEALQRAYGTVPDERFAALLTDLSVHAAARGDGPRPPSGPPSATSDGLSADPSDPGAATWDLVDALAHLAAQDSRDGIARVATSYARKFMPFAAMIGVRHVDERDHCVGWLRSGPAEGVQFHNKPFVIPPDCVLDTALASPSPSLGKPPITPGNAALFGWLGRRRPRTFLVLPILVTDKLVGALVADGGIRTREFGALSELVAFSARLGPAFEVLLRQRHRQHPSLFPQAATDVRVDDETTAAKPVEAKPVEAKPAPAKPAPAKPVEAKPAEARPAEHASSLLAPPAFADVASVPATPPLRRKTQPYFEAVSVPELEKEPASPDAEVTAPLPHLGATPQAAAPTARTGNQSVPAPPPLVPPPPTTPRPITLTAMPRVELTPPAPAPPAPPPAPPAPSALPSAPPLARPSAGPGQPRDGTSPFARNYVATRPVGARPPRPPPPVPVVEDLSGLARITPPAAFAEVADDEATDAWRGALQDTVERGHQGGTMSPEEKARIFLDDEGWEDVRYEAGEVETRSAAALTMPVLVELARAGELDVETTESLSTLRDQEPVVEKPPPSALSAVVEELVDQLEARDDAVVAEARRSLLERGAVVVPALAARFPGRLLVDPFDPGESVRTAAALGPLIDVLYGLGVAGLDAAIPHLDSRFPAHRYAAVLLFALTPDPRSIDLLRARLHDQEPRIRQLAADALAPFVAHGRFEAVLVHLRERLQSPLLDARRRAVQLLGTFRDVGAVPTLMALLDGRGTAELTEDAHQALRVITLQDFGVRARGWERWWQKAKKRSRVDWLIEGLSSEDRELRSLAHVELAALAGDDFGYRPDAPRRLRQKAVAQFEGWWSGEQQRVNPPAG